MSFDGAISILTEEGFKEHIQKNKKAGLIFFKNNGLTIILRKGLTIAFIQGNIAGLDSLEKWNKAFFIAASMSRLNFNIEYNEGFRFTAIRPNKYNTPVGFVISLMDDYKFLQEQISIFAKRISSIDEEYSKFEAKFLDSQIPETKLSLQTKKV